MYNIFMAKQKRSNVKKRCIIVVSMILIDGGSHCLDPEVTLLGDTKWLKLALICAHVVAASFTTVLLPMFMSSVDSLCFIQKKRHKKKELCATILKMVKRGEKRMKPCKQHCLCFLIQGLLWY
jgi:hypothetical protein